MAENYYQQGRSLLEQNDFPGAKVAFQAGADQNNPKCIYGLVAIAAKENTLTDALFSQLKKAIRPLTDLAEAGNSDACFILGRCYETGSAVPRDMVAAVAYYTQAANLGNRDAMFNLGCFYMQHSEGEAAALDWFRKADAAGCPEAKAALEYYRQTH